MASLTVPNTLSNGISADGANLEANFTAVETFCNTEVIQRDGSVAMTAPLSLVAPVSDSHAARLIDVNSLEPIGVIKGYAGTVAPTNYLLCRGQAISRATYATLFTVCGTAYGAGDGSTTFNVPNFQGRSPMGLYPGGPWGTVLGSLIGNADATLVSHNHTGTTGDDSPDHGHSFSGTTSGQSASHWHNSHAVGGFIGLTVGDGSINLTAGTNGLQSAGTDFANQDHTHTYSGATVGAHVRHQHAFTTSTNGSSATNANLAPATIINFIIKAL